MLHLLLEFALGNLALVRSEHNAARERFEQALPLYKQVGSVLGEANCIYGLGDIAFAEGAGDAAEFKYREALALYERLGEPYSVGRAHRRLALLATDSAERAAHVTTAREAFCSIKRDDLIAILDKEFGPA